MLDWAIVGSVATAGGTLVLATATFASVRSANVAARATERALLAGLRPVLIPSRLQDPAEKVGFGARAQPPGPTMAALASHSQRATSGS